MRGPPDTGQGQAQPRLWVSRQVRPWKSHHPGALFFQTLGPDTQRRVCRGRAGRASAQGGRRPQGPCWAPCVPSHCPHRATHARRRGRGPWLKGTGLAGVQGTRPEQTLTWAHPGVAQGDRPGGAQAGAEMPGMQGKAATKPVGRVGLQSRNNPATDHSLRRAAAPSWPGAGATLPAPLRPAAQALAAGAREFPPPRHPQSRGSGPPSGTDPSPEGLSAPALRRTGRSFVSRPWAKNSQTGRHSRRLRET